MCQRSRMARLDHSTPGTMKRALIAFLFAVAASAGTLKGQVPSGEPFRIERLDPALDEIVPKGTTLETLGDRFALTEGPVWVPDGRDGYLLFSENAGNVIYKWQRGKPLSVFLENSGFTGKDASRVGAQTVAGRI